MPPNRRTIFVQRGLTPDVTALRIDVVQRAASRMVPAAMLADVVESDLPNDGWPADDVDAVAKQLERHASRPAAAEGIVRRRQRRRRQRQLAAPQRVASCATTCNGSRFHCRYAARLVDAEQYGSKGFESSRRSLMRMMRGLLVGKKLLCSLALAASLPHRRRRLCFDATKHPGRNRASCEKVGTQRQERLVESRRRVDAQVATPATTRRRRPTAKPGPGVFVAMAADAASANGNFDEAEAQYKKALAMDPNHLGALVGLRPPGRSSQQPRSRHEALSQGRQEASQGRLGAQRPGSLLPPPRHVARSDQIAAEGRRAASARASCIATTWPPCSSSRARTRKRWRN